MEENEKKLPEETSGHPEVVQETELTPENNAAEETTQPIVNEVVAEETQESDEQPDQPQADTVKAPAAETHENEEEDHPHVDEDEAALHEMDFHEAGKADLLAYLKKISGFKNMRTLDKALKETKPAYDKIYHDELEAAKKAFLAEGNEESDFDYKGEEADRKFHEIYATLRHARQRYFADLERSKEENLAKKHELLEKLRELVDGEESTTSINALKHLQTEWKKIGQVPGQHVKTLWASYNALIDRFYDNRSIYFELKELDRRKNLEAKLDICARAEALNSMENIKEAIVQLNELHDEFKHIGPVPQDEQEVIWQRFKAASDQIYAKRKHFFEGLKHELSENAARKMELGQKATEFAKFTSDRINEWNKKTKELLDLQKQWEAIGGLPRDKAKDLNRQFWTSFKQFFANKTAFFKSLESERDINLNKKKELVAKARELMVSDDFDKTANELKKLQNQWREIGPIPEKYRNQIYDEFKAACDHFFERKRSQGNDQNKEFDENLKKKEGICSMLEAYLNSDTIELDQVYELLERYSEIGFVPRNAVKRIHDRYDKVTTELADLEELSDEQRAELKLQIQLSKLKNSPHGNQKIHRKEGAIRRKISTLENDISNWKTNMGFFAESKMASQLKTDFQQKINQAEQELEELKHQLNMLNHM